MEITDANIILRYLLKDDEQFFLKARSIIELMIFSFIKYNQLRQLCSVKF
jgi:hypothetical protein